jgi:hypothetical protein
MEQWVSMLEVHVPKHPLQFQIDEAAYALNNYFTMLQTVVASCPDSVQENLTQILEKHNTRVNFFAAWAGM